MTLEKTSASCSVISVITLSYNDLRTDTDAYEKHELHFCQIESYPSYQKVLGRVFVDGKGHCEQYDLASPFLSLT